MYFILSSKLYESFETYCENNRFRVKISRKGFHKLLQQRMDIESHNVRKVKRHEGEAYKGIKFKDCKRRIGYTT